MYVIISVIIHTWIDFETSSNEVFDEAAKKRI